MYNAANVASGNLGYREGRGLTLSLVLDGEGDAAVLVFGVSCGMAVCGVDGLEARVVKVSVESFSSNSRGFPELNITYSWPRKSLKEMIEFLGLRIRKALA